MNNILTILEKVVKEKRAILIICDDIDQECLAQIALNKMNNTFKICVIKSPMEEYLEDLIIYTNGIKLSESYLGECEKITIDKNKTTIQNDNLSPVLTGKIELLKLQYNNLEGYDKQLTHNRIAKLTSGIATINIGGNSDLEINEIKDRVEDALCATKAAIEEGISKGGGVAYLLSIKEINKKYDGDIQNGINIVKKALEQPLRQILLNANIEPSIIIEKIKKSGKLGYDVKSGKFVDMIKYGIIDPTKVSRVALTNAISIIGTIITTEVVII